MGWLGFGSSKSEDAADSVTRSGRQQCWDGRDAYFACLDRQNVLKAGDEGQACAKEKLDYEHNCARSWIDYFNQRRILAERQKGMLAQAATQAKDAPKPH